MLTDNSIESIPGKPGEKGILFNFKVLKFTLNKKYYYSGEKGDIGIHGRDGVGFPGEQGIPVRFERKFK